ncbi:MAG TPA: helix-turn-helix domain-containing protein [Sideroxyarcus sp.]|nr:helix-turn-helix domain-containing protein [Sideroxyarcus sp.]
MKINQAKTSISCFREYASKNAGAQQQRILSFMQPGRDYTIGELASMTNLEKSTVSGRRKEMIAAGLVILGDERKCKCSGITCQTVKLNVAPQLEMFAA